MGCCASDRSFEEHYELGEYLGEGSFCKVYLATRRDDQEIFAAKVMDALDSELEDDVMNEMKLLKKLNHPNIMKVEEFFSDEDRCVMVCELCSGGELFDQLIEKHVYSEAECRDIVKVILGALAFMHGKGIVHRDLKLQNILLKTPESKSDIVIADFGFAKIIDLEEQNPAREEDGDGFRARARTRRLESNCGESGGHTLRKRGDILTPRPLLTGTLTYCAPEILRDEKYGRGVDIWSLGVLVYILLSGFPPFHAEDEDTVMDSIMNTKIDFTANEQWKHVSQAGKDFVKAMLERNPDKRLNAEQLMEVSLLTQSLCLLSLHRLLLSLHRFSCDSFAPSFTLLSFPIPPQHIWILGDECRQSRSLSSAHLKQFARPSVNAGKIPPPPLSCLALLTDCSCCRLV
jgi:serine/threonine protein kinase